MLPPPTSPICSTPQRPKRMTRVSTTAMGQDTNVLQNSAMETTRIDISHSTSRLLNKLNAKLRTPVLRATELGATPSHLPSVLTCITTSNLPPPLGNAERGRFT